MFTNVRSKISSTQILPQIDQHSITTAILITLYVRNCYTTKWKPGLYKHHKLYLAILTFTWEASLEKILYFYLQRLQRLLIDSGTGTHFYNLVPRRRPRGSWDEDDAIHIKRRKSFSARAGSFSHEIGGCFRVSSEGFVVRVQRQFVSESLTFVPPRHVS